MQAETLISMQTFEKLSICHRCSLQMKISIEYTSLMGLFFHIIECLQALPVSRSLESQHVYDAVHFVLQECQSPRCTTLLKFVISTLQPLSMQYFQYACMYKVVAHCQLAHHQEHALCMARIYKHITAIYRAKIPKYCQSRDVLRAPHKLKGTQASLRRVIFEITGQSYLAIE